MIDSPHHGNGQPAYGPRHPVSAEEQGEEPDDDIEYDEILATTEADYRAGRFTHYKTFDEFKADYIRRTDETIRRARAEGAP